MILCCEKLRINGVVTHEIGCPEAWRDYDRECRWCGTMFKPEDKGQECCSDDCTESFRGG